MALLSDNNKKRIEDFFISFMEKEKIFFKEILVSRAYHYDYLVEIKSIDSGMPYEGFISQLSKEYLWCDKAHYKSNEKDFNFNKCDFSFYFKFIKDSQNILTTKETVFLLKNKFFFSVFKVFNELIDLNNFDVSKGFFTHNFLVSKLDLFVENYKRFSFTHEEDKYFFDILEKSAFFKKDSFRNKVYKLVKEKFTNPDFFMERFPKVLIDENSGLFISKRAPSFFLDIEKKKLYDLNLMREYKIKDVNSLLNIILVQIHECGNLFGINNYIFSQDQYTSEVKDLTICFVGESDNNFKIDLLRNVFNKYVASVLSENTFNGAIKQLNEGIVLDKIILEESLPKASLGHKKHKI